MVVEVREELGYFSVYVDNKRMVDRESFAIADRIRYYLEHPDKWDYTECCEVAQGRIGLIMEITLN